MTGHYATSTDVPSGRSREEIEKVISKYGAHQFAYGWSNGYAMVGFVMDDEDGNARQVRFALPLPDRQATTFTHTPGRNQRRAPAAAEAAYEQAVRQRWRALSLIIKAKLEAVEVGVVEWTSEFGAHIVLPDGTTVAQHLRIFVDESYRTGLVPALLPAISGPPAITATT